MSNRDITSYIRTTDLLSFLVRIGIVNWEEYVDIVNALEENMYGKG